MNASISAGMGSKWTTLEVLLEKHHNEIKEQEPGLTGIGTQPPFAIGQRALLVQTPQGNTLWTVSRCWSRRRWRRSPRGRGASDCHLAPALLFNDDRVEPGVRCADLPARGRPPARDAPGPGDPLLGGRDTVAGRTDIGPLWGHFAGGMVLHWPGGAEGRGVVLSGDILMVVPDRRI